MAYRGWQEVRIHALWLAGGWQRLARRVEEFWTRERVAALFDAASPPIVVMPSGCDALHQQLDRHPSRGAALVAFAEEIRRRRFSVLGAQIPTDGPWPWHSDWRWGKSWDRQFFRTYDPYEDREVPFDIKIPWELSRMTFVPPLVQAAVIGGDDSFRHAAEAILTDWEHQNPLAFSVNWHPMEASMRGVGLALVLGMLRSSGNRDPGLRAVVARLAASHGEFVARTVEYSDVRGNHYMANVVALLVLGLSLQHVYPRARQWTRFGVRELPRECATQFLPDGVNFEGSVPYHRFVAELALIGLLASERGGFPVDAAMKGRVHLACRYAATCQRPDGLLPVVGDNDSAIVFPWDPEPARDPASLRAVSSIVFDDPALRGADAGAPPAAVAWVMGEAGSRWWYERHPAHEERSFAFLPDGGVVVARNAGDYLWMDVGEVGLAGRGGHGHNDLGSFELSLGGRPIVIDAGCPVYSGDPAARNAFRSTGAHNTLQVDGAEMARFGGLWTIANEARPLHVNVVAQADRVVAAFEHHGYRRLADPVTVGRTVTFFPGEERLACRDTVRARGRHALARHLHLHPQVRADAVEGGISLASGERRWKLTCDPFCRATIERRTTSPEYGVVEASDVVLLSNTTNGDAELFFVIEPASEVSSPTTGRATMNDETE